MPPGKTVLPRLVPQYYRTADVISSSSWRIDHSVPALGVRDGMRREVRALPTVTDWLLSSNFVCDREGQLSSSSRSMNTKTRSYDLRMSCKTGAV